MKRAGVTNPFRVVETNVKGFTNFYSGYHQKVLPTEFVVDGIRDLPDVEDFSIMRFAQAGLYRNPFIDDMELRADQGFLLESTEWLDYTQLVAEYEKHGEEFGGTWSQEKLWFIEQWVDNGSDGHVEWVHASNVHVRVLSSSAAVLGRRDSPRGVDVLKSASGSQIQEWLSEAIRAYDEDRRMKNRVNEPRMNDDDHANPYKDQL